jgi:fatty-acyl-CoA synthase
MNAAITEAPTGTTMVLRALARFPERTAFAWDDGSLTYRATLDLIGRLQAAMVAAGLAKGQTAAFLSANSAETWCAGVAASGLGLVTTWLYPLGALADHLDVIEDAGAIALIVDPKTHAQRGGELAAKAADRLGVVLTMGRADCRDVMAAAEKSARPCRSISRIPTITPSSTTPAARPASPRAPSAATARPPP